VADTPRQPLLIVQSLYPALPQAVLYRDTVYGSGMNPPHVPIDRKLGMPVVDAVKAGVEQAYAAVIGTSNPGYVAFVCNDVTSQNSQSPLVVIVDPAGNPMPTVTSVSFRRDFKNISQHTVLWRRDQDKD
jgi:hypothetical protein